MIIGLILQIFYTFVSFIISLFPNATTMPAGFTNAWNWGLTGIANLLYLISDFDDILYILGLIIVIEFVIFKFNIIHWAYNKLRGSGK